TRAAIYTVRSHFHRLWIFWGFAMPPPADIVKVAIEWPGAYPKLMEIDQKKPLSAIIKEVCDGWSLANHEYFALQHADSSNFYITEKASDPDGDQKLTPYPNRAPLAPRTVLLFRESGMERAETGTGYSDFKNRNEIKNGTILRLTTSPAQNAHQLHERIQSSSMDAKLEALKDLASLSRDVTFAQEFINLDGISLLTQMTIPEIAEDHEALHHSFGDDAEFSSFGDMLSFTLTAFVELMDHGIVSWDTFSVAFIKKIASFVNKSAIDVSILQRSLAILESMVLNSHDLYQKVAQEITIGQLIPHLQGTDQEIQTYTIAVINALFLKAPDEKRQEMANILAQKQLRSIILTHVIRAQRAINNEMAHQLYVLQVLTFNLLEDRMMTKMDPQDQRDIIFELRRIAFDAESEPNNSSGSMEKRKSMYTRDYKKLGFIRRDHSFVEVVAAHKEKEKLASESLWQNSGRLDIGLYLPVIEPRGADHQTELLHETKGEVVKELMEPLAVFTGANMTLGVERLEDKPREHGGHKTQNHVNPAMDFTQTPPGMLALDNMLYFAKHHQDAYIRGEEPRFSRRWEDKVALVPPFFRPITISISTKGNIEDGSLLAPKSLREDPTVALHVDFRRCSWNLNTALYNYKPFRMIHFQIVLENSSREDKHECPFGRSSIELTKMLCEILKVGELRKTLVIAAGKTIHIQIREHRRKGCARDNPLVVIAITSACKSPLTDVVVSLSRAEFHPSPNTQLGFIKRIHQYRKYKRAKHCSSSERKQYLIKQSVIARGGKKLIMSKEEFLWEIPHLWQVILTKVLRAMLNTTKKENWELTEARKAAPVALGDQFEVSAVQRDLVQCLYLLRAFLFPIDDRAGQHGQIPASQVHKQVWGFRTASAILFSEIRIPIHKTSETCNDFHPMFFTHDRSFEEFFCICIQLLNKTWKEMRATSEDFNKMATKRLSSAEDRRAFQQSIPFRLRHIELSILGPKDTDIITGFGSSAYDHLIMKTREREVAVCYKSNHENRINLFNNMLQSLLRGNPSLLKMTCIDNFSQICKWKDKAHSKFGYILKEDRNPGGWSACGIFQAEECGCFQVSGQHVKGKKYSHRASIDWVPTIQSWTTLNLELEDFKYTISKGVSIGFNCQDADPKGPWRAGPISRVLHWSNPIGRYSDEDESTLIEAMVMQVVKEQVMRALTTKPSSLDQFKSKLQNLSYTEILKIRQSERMNQEDFQSRPILELKEKIQPEILELIKQQRLNRLVEGTCFRKLNCRRRQDKFWYCRLSPNHKVLHYGDLEESPQGEVPHDSLQDKLPVADIKAVVTGKDCPHMKEKGALKQNKACSSLPLGLLDRRGETCSLKGELAKMCPQEVCQCMAVGSTQGVLLPLQLFQLENDVDRWWRANIIKVNARRDGQMRQVTQSNVMTAPLIHVFTGKCVRRAKPKVCRPPPFSSCSLPCRRESATKDNQADTLVSTKWQAWSNVSRQSIVSSTLSYWPPKVTWCCCNVLTGCPEAKPVLSFLSSLSSMSQRLFLMNDTKISKEVIIYISVSHLRTIFMNGEDALRERHPANAGPLEFTWKNSFSSEILKSEGIDFIFLPAVLLSGGILAVTYWPKANPLTDVEEVLELAFSILYDSNCQLNFIAPDKHEREERLYANPAFRVVLKYNSVLLDISFTEGDDFVFIFLKIDIYCIWTDGLNALLGKDMMSDLTRNDLDTLLSMEIKLRLLDLENIQIPDAPPPIPKEPSNYDFVYDCN
ncbi:hypothetical protein E2I00_003934, partial [Balaenoptera physalus]